MKRVYEQPQWAIGFNKFWRPFCSSCRALVEVFFDIGGSVAAGGGFVAGKIFAITGNALDPVIAARIFIGAAVAAQIWGLWSWCWIGITLGSFLGIPGGVAGIVGLIAGILLNLAEIMPEVGSLFKEYANVLGRAGEDAKARSWHQNGISAENFGGYSYDRLKTARNLGFIVELSSSLLYQVAVGGFTKTVIVKGISVIKPLAFGPMMGSVVWCLALVFVPEWSIKTAAAAIHVASQLPERNYA